MNTNEELLCQQLTNDVMEIFSTMVGMGELLHHPVQVDPVTHFKDCLSALVGLAGTYSGVVSVHMPSVLALKATSCMLGMEITEQNNDVKDAMGEISNMIAGSFKQHLSKSGSDIRLSTPSVIYGRDYVVTLGSIPEQIALRFAAGDEWFLVSVALDET